MHQEDQAAGDKDRQERDTLRKKLQRKTISEDARLTLASHLGTGYQILQVEVVSEDDVEPWLWDYHAWVERVSVDLKKLFSEADVHSFLLPSMTTPGLCYSFVTNHNIAANELSRRLDNLKQIVDRLADRGAD